MSDVPENCCPDCLATLIDGRCDWCGGDGPNRMINPDMEQHTRADLDKGPREAWQAAMDHHAGRNAAWVHQASNHYRILLGDAFFRRLQGTWSPLINPAPVVIKEAGI
jgi:hypothetical protein